MSIASFRAEINDSAKVVYELNKLKVILIAGLLAIAFGAGLSSRVGDYSYLTLAFVPFICLYIDAHYYHCLAKMYVLARFLAEADASSEEGFVVKHYESFMARIRKDANPNVFSFESNGQFIASVLLSAACPLLGVIAIVATLASAPSSLPLFTAANVGPLAMVVALVVSSLIGIRLLYWLFLGFKAEMAAMKNVALPDAPVRPPGLGEMVTAKSANQSRAQANVFPIEDKTE